jgi:hypothetical protein
MMFLSEFYDIVDQHLTDKSEELMAAAIVQSLGTMLNTVVF